MIALAGCTKATAAERAPNTVMAHEILLMDYSLLWPNDNV